MASLSKTRQFFAHLASRAECKAERSGWRSINDKGRVISVASYWMLRIVRHSLSHRETALTLRGHSKEDREVIHRLQRAWVRGVLATLSPAATGHAWRPDKRQERHQEPRVTCNRMILAWQRIHARQKATMLLHKEGS